MSDIVKDQKVVTDGRRNPLKDVDAPLRDQIVEKLYRKLDEMSIGLRVRDMWHAGNANRATWLKRQAEYLRSWDEHLVNEASGPFEGSSNLHIPMPLTVVKTFHARMLQAIWGIDPPFFARARNEASIESVPTVTDTLRYTLYDYANHNKGIEDVVDRWVWDWCSAGLAIKKWRWDVAYTRFLDVQEVAEASLRTNPQTGELEKFPKLVEKEVEVTKKCFDGPACELVDPEDYLPVGGSTLDPDRADSVIHRQWLTASDLWTLADRKVFKMGVVEDVIRGGADSKTGASNSELKSQRAQDSGVASLDTEADLDRYEILECYTKVPVDGSGINSDVIVWVHARSGKLLRATYLHRVSKTGERPFAVAEFHHRKGEAYPVGLVEMLYPLSVEMDMLHNMRLDMGMVSVMPFGFYRASSSLDPKTIELRPGALIPTDNPQQDVHFPNLGNRALWGFQEEQAIQTMVERLTSVSDLNLGVMGGQGAARTATGARALVSEMSGNLDVYLRRLNRGWKKSIRYCLHMLQQRIPAGLSFRLTGEDGKDYWRTIRSVADIAGDFDIEVSPNSASSNQGVQQDQANQIMQMLQNPLAIQMGVVQQAGLYEGYKNWFQAYGVKDFGRYIQKPQGYERMLTPEEEANRLLRGQDVPVLPGGDHEGFIAWYEHVKGDDEIFGQFHGHEAALLEIQSRKHAQMLQALQQMQAQQANAQQMRTNGQMSQEQAPTAGAGQGPQGAPPIPAAG